MSGPILVYSSNAPTPDYLAEAGEILRNADAPFILRLEHLQALQEVLANAVKVSTLTNRALIGLMLDSGVPHICIPAGLVQSIEDQHLDLTLEYRHGTIVATIARPHVGPTN